MEKLRVVFIGKDGPFSTRPLRAVAAAHHVPLVVESAPRNYGAPAATAGLAARLRRRFINRRDPGRILARVAADIGAEFVRLASDGQPALIERVRAVRPDVICIASLSQLLKKEALDIPKLGSINLHPSLLPAYRGPNPWFWQYFHAERRSGVSAILVDEKSDTGNILRQEAFEVPPGLPFEEFLEKVAELNARLVIPALSDLAAGQRGAEQRSAPCPFYARRMSADEPLVDWTEWPIERTWHLLRGGIRWTRTVPPPSGWRRGFEWRVDGFEKDPEGARPGEIGRDRKGFFVGHREGRIRLSVRI